MSNTTIIEVAVAALAYAGLHFHLFMATRLPKRLESMSLDHKEQLHGAFTELGQKIENGKISGHIERIICAKCGRKVFKFNAAGVCTDCEHK